MPLPDADNAAVGSHHGDFLQEVPHRCFLFLFALVWKRRKKDPRFVRAALRHAAAG